jgi:hypothetical protein
MLMAGLEMKNPQFRRCQMNGFIKKAVAGSCLSASLALLLGCDHYRDLVDPCWPERYNYIARHSIRDMFNAQADRGHMLEQTLWNWHFEADPKSGGPSDRLNGAGQEVLRRIARTQPAPDHQLFLQNAQDIPYVEGIAPEKLVAQREALNKRRMENVQRFLATQMMAGGAYQIAVHDFTPNSLPGHWPNMAIDAIEKNVKNGMPQVIVAPTYTTK